MVVLGLSISEVFLPVTHSVSLLAPGSHVSALSAAGVYAVYPSSDPAQAVEEVGILFGYFLVTARNKNFGGHV